MKVNLYLWQSEFEKNETPNKRIANCDIAEKMLKYQAQKPLWIFYYLTGGAQQEWKKEKQREREVAYLKFNPLVKQEDKKQRDPKPNQRVDLDTSFHIIKSVINCPARSSSPPFSSSASISKHQRNTSITIHIFYYSIFTSTALRLILF